jgi:hypothetical protein
MSTARLRPVGQIASDIQNSEVKPKSKNILLFRIHEQRYTSAIPARTEGRFAIVTNVGPGMRWTRRSQGRMFPLRTVKSCGSGAATLASSLWSNPLMTVANKAAHREEHEVRRKAIAWGMSECLR